MSMQNEGSGTYICIMVGLFVHEIQFAKYGYSIHGHMVYTSDFIYVTNAHVSFIYALKNMPYMAYIWNVVGICFWLNTIHHFINGPERRQLHWNLLV